MALEKEQNPLSDTEGGEERTAREHLKKTHITHQQNAPRSELDAADTLAPEGTQSNGANATTAPQSLHRKRSHEEIDADSQEAISQPPRHHARKRSRDSTAEEDELNNGQRKSGERIRDGDETVEIEQAHVNGSAKSPRASTPEHHDQKRTQDPAEAVASPKTKRSRRHSTTAEDKDVSVAPAADAEKIAESAKLDLQRDKMTEGTTKIPPTSGFANASVTSPFGSLAGGKSPAKSQTTEPQTSSSAFAASGFGALSGSTTSAFGSIGKETGGFGSGGSFATGAKSPSNASDNTKPLSPPSSSFGGSLAQKSPFASAGDAGSGFGSSTSGFASSGIGGFGGGLGGTGFSTIGGGGLSSFASGKPLAPLGGAAPAVKPFGAPADPEEGVKAGDGGDKTGPKGPLATEKDEQHEQFYEQVMATGEEDEVTELTSRAKLYNFAPNPANDNKKEWRERGMGVLRLNVLKALSDEEDQKPTARLLMRADGSHRVLLNTPIKKELTFGAPTGGKPTGGYLYFMGTIDGGLEMLQLKLKQANALDLYEHIESLQKEM
ncbi:hypothetical protein DOTSEDRAFT_75765 [Dothistroma septosporum NZE10]|uniref:RanBD1 domain-containing protein n=1 Tax=Dothistroma septosporum (strain NZE10 / CBS 128990) TaxID=675120 RepID=N1PBP1_DOTSN|nr:hypothetical protein DOTSEDRAFT_75765 [Dothistroma septosporum NZE10]